MRAASLPPLAGLLALGLLCAACGETPEHDGAPGTPRTPHWQVHAMQDDAVRVVPPDARLGLASRDSSVPRQVVSLLPSGDLPFDAGFEEVHFPREGLVVKRPAGGS